MIMSKLSRPNEVTAEAGIESAGNYELATAYSRIFWPSFVRFENYVLREGFSMEMLRELEDITNCHTSAIEEAVNRIIIDKIHSSPPAAVEQIRSLGRVLKEIYSVKLQRDFGEFEFEVSFNDEPGLEASDYELTFWRPDTLR